MTKLTLNHNYLLQLVGGGCTKKMRKFINKHYKFIKRKDGKLIFTNGETTFTLWNNHRYEENYSCSMTLDKNDNYRITKYGLNPHSIYVWIKIYPIELTYLKSHISITTIEKFLFVIDLYNKVNIKKKLTKYSAIRKVFQDTYMVRYLSEFL